MAMIIRVRNFHADSRIDVVLGERVRRRSDAFDLTAVTEPVIKQRAEAVVVPQSGRVDGQRRILFSIPHKQNLPGQGVIDIRNSIRGGGCDNLGRAECISVSDSHTELSIDISIAEPIRVAGRSGDRDAISKPLKLERSQSVVISKR